MPKHPNSLANLREPFKKGQSGNPAGRGGSTAGASLREWLNAFSDRELTAADLRKIAQDESASYTKRAAALRALRMIEQPDLADFEPYLDGSKTLDELRELGVSTEAVRKAKLRVRDDGTVEREIELFDRSGEDFDRVSNRTEGMPKPTVQHEGDITHHIKRIIIEDGAADTWRN